MAEQRQQIGESRQNGTPGQAAENSADKIPGQVNAPADRGTWRSAGTRSRSSTAGVRRPAQEGGG